MIKGTVISLIKGDKRSVYISVKKRPEMLAPLHHKLRVKSIIYGCLIGTYNPEMDFTNTLNAGWTIEYDNRNSYEHKIIIVPSYSRHKKEKEEKVCFYCGQAVKKKKKNV